MRTAYAHQAELLIDDGTDVAAPGGAVTVALCGSWDHDGPCPLAPHHTSAVPDGAHLRVRVLFAVEPELESTTRRRIDDALAAGRLATPAGETAAWTLAGSGTSPVLPEELEHAERLVRSPK